MDRSRRSGSAGIIHRIMPVQICIADGDCIIARTPRHLKTTVFSVVVSRRLRESAVYTVLCHTLSVFKYII